MPSPACEEGTDPSPPVAFHPANFRAAPRHTLLIRSAKLILGPAEYLCVLRDISETGVAVRLFHHLAPLATMVLELQNEERHEVALVWHREDRMGMRFSHPVDVHRLIEAPSPFKRRPIRLRVERPAVLSLGEENTMCSLLDLSQHGAKLACDRIFAIDQRVRLVAAGMPQVQAKVRWRREDRLGLVFENTFQLGELAGIVAGFHAASPDRAGAALIMAE